MSTIGLIVFFIVGVLTLTMVMVGLILWLDWKGGQLVDEENREIDDLVEKQQSER